MARIVSFVVLVVILLIIGGLFLQVMAGFLLPLFLALLLVVVFGPLHRWFLGKCGRHDRIAALLTTGAILALVLIPLLLLLAAAGREAGKIYKVAMNSPTMTGRDEAGDAPASPTKAPDKAGDAKSKAADKTGEAGDAKSKAPDETDAAAEGESNGPDLTKLIDQGTAKLIDLGNRIGLTLDRGDIQASAEKAARQFLAPLALRTTQFLGGALLGLLVMILGVYYFFADGPAMVQTLLRLLPLEQGRTRELIDQFDSVTRAVVVATLLSAFVQGLLAGIGFYVAGVGSVFLLTALAMLLTLVPFLGAALVWVPVCLWLAVGLPEFGIQARPMAAVFLAAYCIGVVSMVDNVVKPLVLHGRSNLHPLLALLSVLGGVQALGPIGILVGPMVVAFLQTLLNMVHSELNKITATPTVAIDAPSTG